ncbi:amino acid transporter [Aspergillus heteromorphus CBS 117.55]|uniref:Amino acid transporter n=1 Tax=Aspergillus heteromorphus CBS 117.55 TaxID=1448321 RepID=A0A317V375_9EURO|nr:amino acid transporter [Aspergillus heteromorphus CBS 117.55]PWY68486.1 amino acid transporter [Aspergillus heteromorphus CBS 117.55]
MIPVQSGNPEKLKQELFGFQIFFITLSAVIGSGIFTNNGVALAIAGPMGLMLAALVMSVVVCAVNECIAELTQQFPVYNAIVEYVRTFVDDDLGWVIGLAYWYAYTASFSSQTVMAGTLLEYWGLSQAWRALICYALIPFVLFLLNLTGVFWYGLVETFGGFLKLIMIFGISIYLYAISDRVHLDERGNVFSPTFDHGRGFRNNVDAACYAIPLTAYAFQGVELYAMAAFEARDAHALRWPSRWTIYIIVLVYIMCTLGEILNVSWQDPNLSQLDDGIVNATVPSTSKPGVSSSMVIIAALNVENKHMADFLNACLLVSVISASNTSLYVASRTLFGIAKSMPRDYWATRHLAILSKGTRVPVVALLVTLLAFAWVPFLQLSGSTTTKQLTEVISTSSSTAIMIVWASVCIAFLRYYYWLKKCDPDLRLSGRPEFVRGSPNYTPRGSLFVLQPLQAWIGLIGCTVIFAFSSATWWDGHATVTEVAMAYGAHIVLVILFLGLKLSRRQPEWFKRTPDAGKLVLILNDLRVRKIDRWETTRWKRLQSVFLRYRGLRRGSEGADADGGGPVPLVEDGGRSMMGRSEGLSS